jgi:hypothetical protein
VRFFKHQGSEYRHGTLLKNNTAMPEYSNWKKCIICQSFNPAMLEQRQCGCWMATLYTNQLTSTVIINNKLGNLSRQPQDWILHQGNALFQHTASTQPAD